MNSFIGFLSSPFIQEYIQTAKFVASSAIGAFIVQAVFKKVKSPQKTIIGTVFLITATGAAAYLRTVLSTNPQPYLIMLFIGMAIESALHASRCSKK